MRIASLMSTDNMAAPALLFRRRSVELSLINANHVQLSFHAS